MSCVAGDYDDCDEEPDAGNHTESELHRQDILPQP